MRFLTDSGLSPQLYIPGLAYSVGLSQELRDEMEAYARGLGFQDVTWTQVGGVISSHCGPTAFGAVLLQKA